MNSIRARWSSHFGFLMATIGFAIGLGNIWRFPYLVGMNGGGAFLIVYLLCCIFIGIPLFTAEISLGRKSQRTPIAGMNLLTGNKQNPWNLIGWFGMFAALLILSYYVMLIGWILAYLVKIVSGTFIGMDAEMINQVHTEFVTDPVQVIIYTGVVTLMTTVLVAGGLKNGIERFAKIAMPLLFFLMIGLSVYAISLPGSIEGLKWYLTPDFTKLTPEVILAALGQSFYSIGIGMAAAFCYGSYLTGKSDVPGDAASVVAFDTLAAVLAGFVIFPALFSFQIEPDAGPELLFIAMTNLFGQMSGGIGFGSAFFLLLLLAGITSAMALMEVLRSSLAESANMGIKKSAWIVCAVIFLLSIPVVLSQGPWASYTLFGMDIFGLVDFASSNIFLTAGALLLVLYVAYVWKFDSFKQETNQGSGVVKVSTLWKPFMIFIIPAVVLLILLYGLGIIGL